MLPDFIIGGAMKSGTSTLHQILDTHPEIFIPKSEIHFFDIDNILQHSDFNFYDVDKDFWSTQSMKNSPNKLWNWYGSKFAGKGQLIKGEDSTTYLASKVAAKRISLQEKPIKLIFTLRQPTLRAYSNYWHLLRTGRAMFTFENTIRYNPFSILNRSLYKEQLVHYYTFLPRESIKVVLFEDLVINPRSVITEISEFIGIDINAFPKDVFELHSNKGTFPQNIDLQIKKNKLMRSFGNIRYVNSLPVKPNLPVKDHSLSTRVINKISRKINPMRKTDLPKINKGTKQFLDEYFYKELKGIDELVDKDILSRWFNF